jgi:uncharacterized protein DUF1631
MANLNFGDPEQRGQMASPYAVILAECRDIVLDRLGAAICGALQRIEERLDEKRGNAGDTDQAKMYAEVRRKLDAVSGELDRRFRAMFQRAFQQRAAPKVQRDVYAGGGDFPLELALVDEDQVSDEVRVRNLAKQFGSSCEGELNDLRRRVAYMLGEAEVEAERDPLGPEAIAQVLKDVCWQIDGPHPIRVLLLEELGRELVGEVPALYGDINRHLVARQVLPRVSHVLKRSKSGSLGGGRAPVSNRGDTAETEMSWAANRGSVIQQLLSPHDGVSSPVTRSQLGVSERTNTEFLKLLTRLQRGESDPGFDLSSLPAATDSGAPTNVLRAFVEAGLNKRAGSFDALLIDVVATLFDYIFNDPRVPEPMKGLIGRLQIPVLKLALIDHGFFSNRSHPARRLINLLARAAADWEGEFTAEAPLYRAAEAWVVRIQNEFLDDVQLFVTCLEELENFLADEERCADAKAAALTRQLEERERNEIAAAVAQNAVAIHLSDDRIPEAVKRFLDGPWKQVMALAAAAGGEDGARWRRAASTMDDLIWSVFPKRDAEERRKLVQVLPALLRGLREGSEEAGIAAEEREHFLAALVKLHAAAVKSGMAPRAARAPAAPGTSATPAAGKRAADTSGWVANAADSGPQNLEALARGCWIDFEETGGTPRRVRLSWISPARTMFLFTNRQGARAMALNRSELSRLFSEGKAALADEAPLIDRAVQNVLEDLQTGS